MQVTPTAQINLSAIRHNLSEAKRLSPGSKQMAVIKADAYGHGLLEVANSLTGSDAFAVARLEEALLLRRELVKSRIVLLSSPLNLEELQLCAEQQIDVVIHSPETMPLLAQLSQTH